jgi:N-acetylmuramoyl-L-alanine amidase
MGDGMGVGFCFLCFRGGEREIQGQKSRKFCLGSGFGFSTLKRREEEGFSPSSLLRLAFILLLTLFTLTLAQQRLIVNGLEVAGMSTTLVSGSSYAPALALADAIGAARSYDAEAGLATFDYASHLLTMRVYGSAGEAKSDTQALQLDGRTVPGTGGVSLDGNLYVPVKAVVAAFGGSVEYSDVRQAVLVVFPRATLQSATVKQVQGYDRFVLEFAGLTPYRSYFNQAVGLLQVRFERLTPAQSQSFSGQLFNGATLQQSGGYTDLLIRMNAETHYESYTAPRTGGFSLILDVLPTTAQRQDPVTTPAVVIDAGHGGNDPGLVVPEGTESELTLQLAQRLSESLQGAGLASDLTRTDNITLSVGERSQQGIGSSLYLSIHVADDLTPGQMNVYYLSEASDAASLDLAIRQNAKAALDQPGTDVMRRRLLLNLVPDMKRGEAYANGIARELSQLGGYTANNVAGLPLKVLEGAAGRGVLIEFNASNLIDPQLATNLAAAIRSVLAQEGF